MLYPILALNSAPGHVDNATTVSARTYLKHISLAGKAKRTCYKTTLSQQSYFAPAVCSQTMNTLTYSVYFVLYKVKLLGANDM